MTDIRLKTSVGAAYLMRVLMFLNMSSMVSFWITLEINILVFIYMIRRILPDQESERSMMCFRYLVSQSIGSIMFITGSILVRVQESFIFQIYMIIGLLIKIGIFPFHRWVYNLCASLPIILVALLLTIQKIPVLLLLTYIKLEASYSIITLRSIFGSLFLIYRENIRELIVSSSLYFTFWVWVIFQLRSIWFMVIYILYAISTIIVLGASENIDKGLIESSEKLNIVISIIFLVGIPPIRMFFFKAYGMAILPLIVSRRICAIIIFSLLVVLIGYLKAIIPIISMRTRCYPAFKRSYNKSRIWVIVLTLCYFVFSVV